MLNDSELLNIKGGSSVSYTYWDYRFPMLSLTARYFHVVYLMHKLFVD